nr:PhzF family phenazine biosynthesis protein [Pseudomonas sp. M47T1]
MQAIAIENSLPETAFFVRNAQGQYEIRWFSPLTESISADMRRWLVRSCCSTSRMRHNRSLSGPRQSARFQCSNCRTARLS